MNLVGRDVDAFGWRVKLNGALDRGRGAKQLGRAYRDTAPGSSTDRALHLSELDGKRSHIFVAFWYYM
ncbi:hypothetical protein ACSFA8_26505 [Variovorax sp. RT4R15]|uniref:hypothetical protein n=1 Tax=Variovorax sp. RT4R15 TaxID=3443737 RepID=UPI003F44DA9A